jgi:hypothetical protein
MLEVRLFISKSPIQYTDVEMAIAMAIVALPARAQL